MFYMGIMLRHKENIIVLSNTLDFNKNMYVIRYLNSKEVLNTKNKSLYLLCK